MTENCSLSNGGMMRRSIRCGAAGAIALVLCGCDELPKARLFNNTGRTVQLHYLDEGRDAVVDIKQGEGFKSIWAYGADKHFGLSGGGCRRAYTWPEMGVNHPFESYDYKYPVRAQIEPDFTIQLLPDAAEAVAPINSLRGMQRGGFPLRPRKTMCP